MSGGGPVPDVLRSLGLTFAVIGAQRGGSTFVGHRLGATPGVALPELEVPLFEDRWWQGRVDPAETARLFPTRRDGVRGIRRPDLLGKPELAGRLAEVGIDRCVVSLRPPVDRTISAAYWYMFVGRIDVPSNIDRYLLDLVERWQRGSVGGVEEELVDFSFYGRHLLRWDAELDGRIHLTSSATFERELRACLGFLGVDPEAAASDRRTRAELPTLRSPVNGGIRDLRRLRLLRHRLRFSADWDRETQFRVNRDATRIRTPRWRRSLNAGVHAVDRAVAIARPTRNEQVSAEVVSALAELFEDDLALLTSRFPNAAGLVSR